MFKKIAAVLSFTAIAACNPQHEDTYKFTTECSKLGYERGTEEHQQCVDEKVKESLMLQNRAEYEQRQADEEYWRARRGVYQ